MAAVDMSLRLYMTGVDMSLRHVMMCVDPYYLGHGA